MKNKVEKIVNDILYNFEGEIVKKDNEETVIRHFSNHKKKSYDICVHHTDDDNNIEVSVNETENENQNINRQEFDLNVNKYLSIHKFIKNSILA